MLRARWLLVTMALAILVPWDQAQAVRIQRSREAPAASSAEARPARVARWRDSVRAPPGRGVSVRAARGRGADATVDGPAGVVRGPLGAERVTRGRELGGSARVDLQIGRTRRMLDLVRDRAERCGSAEARGAVRRAIEMQDRAESAARAGRSLGALQLTREARQQGVAALRHCGHTGGVPEGVVSALGRTDELLGLERERLVDRPAAVAGERTGALERAAAAQRQARAEFRDGRLESSLRLTQEARQSLRSGARREAGTWRDGAQRDATRRETAPRDAAARPRTRRD